MKPIDSQNEAIQNYGAREDYPDLRDQYYTPSLAILAEELYPEALFDAEGRPSSPVRHQHQDPTCVGHALASLIELQRRKQRSDLNERVSASMLYQMARFHDSLRGEPELRAAQGVRGLRSAIKAFYHHGASLSAGAPDDSVWSDERYDYPTWPSEAQAKAAEGRVLGAYFRLRPILNHYTTAIFETGGVLVSARIHSGWNPGGRLATGRIDGDRGETSDLGMHAFLLVGYTTEGFLVLNSWGEDWSSYPVRSGDRLAGREIMAPGVALWSYRDWARSVVDGWVLRLGVPGPNAFPVNTGEWGQPENPLDAGRARYGSTPYRDLRGSFMNLEGGRAVEHGAYATPTGAIDANVKGLIRQIPDSAGVLIRVPGVLEGIDEAFTTAVRQKREAARSGLLYFTCFWCADFAAEVIGITDDIYKRCARQAGTSRHVDTLFEATARNAGRAFWHDIERHAREAVFECDTPLDPQEEKKQCVPRGRFGTTFIEIEQACRDAGKPLHLVADGAGALVIEALARRLQGAAGSAPASSWLPALRSLALIAPVVPVPDDDPLESPLIKLLEACRARQRGSARILVPDEQTEARLAVHDYGRSILHLVANSFRKETPDETPRPMLGMAAVVDARQHPELARIGEPDDDRLCETFSVDGAGRLQQSEISRAPKLLEQVREIIKAGQAAAVRPASDDQKEMGEPMAKKIAFDELERRIADGTLTPEEAAAYFVLDPEKSTPFAPKLTVNPETVALPPEEPEEGRSALALNALNEIDRFRRKAEFYRRVAAGDKAPRLAAEGDSWFQYPLLLEDVIDVVSRDFPVYDTSAAGDLLENMAARRDYIRSLRESGAEILLLSAGGNDLCAGGALATHLERYDPALLPADYLKRSYQAVLDNAMAQYERICRDVRASFPNVTIITHGYDYTLPNAGRWLGEPMLAQGITDRDLQRHIVAEMVDQFNRALRRMVEAMPHVVYVDCRGAVSADGWYDELHPRDPGFEQVAGRIIAAIRTIAEQTAATAAPRGATIAGPALVRPEPRAWSLHVALNRVDPNHYAGWSGELRGCVNDARAMQALVEAEGWEPRPLLLNEAATREAVQEELRKAAKTLEAGDSFLFTYSGHGGQVPDWNNDEPELSGKHQPDSTLCLYDCQLIDDELFALWTGFASGVRILAIPDSCHSGSVVRAALPSAAILQASSPAELKAMSMGPVELLPRTMPASVASDVVAENESQYRRMSHSFDHIDERLVTSPVRTPMRASLIQISACQDEETAFDGNEHGLFTAALLKIWNRGSFKENHREFHRRIAAEIAASQNPRLLELPPADPSFVRQRPFTLFGRRPAGEKPPTADGPRMLEVLLITEGDEDDLPQEGTRAAPLPRGFEDRATLERFDAFMRPLGLKHFQPAEFLFLGNSHHGSGAAHGLNGYPPEDKWGNIVPTASVLDELRSRLGAPIHISSAYRNEAYNAAVGGEKNSMHTQFRACDIAVDGVSPSKVADQLTRMRGEGLFRGGIGRYPGFTHVDTRGVNADWGRNGRKAPPPTGATEQGEDADASAILDFAVPAFPLRAKPRRRGRAAPAEGMVDDLATAQGAVNGAGVVAFDPAMSEDVRRAVLYSTQFAQRAADARADAVADRLTWWSVYGAALRAVGWGTQGSLFRRAVSDRLEVSIDSLALDAIKALAPGVGQLAAITSLLETLRQAADNDRRIELLDLYSSQSGGGLFQLGAAEMAGREVVSMALGAVQFSKVDERRKIVFVSWGAEKSDFWVAAERMSLNLDFYMSRAQPIVEQKIADAAELILAFKVSEPVRSPP